MFYLNRFGSTSYTHGEAFDICTKVVINSSIAIACGPYFDRDIMHAIDICVDDVRITKNRDYAKLTLPIIEAQCEASLLRHPDKPYKDTISRALNCPNDCNGQGTCHLGQKCLCQEHYQGYDCSLQTETLMRIDKKATHRLCDKSIVGSCQQVLVIGSNFDPKGSCNGKYEFVSPTEILCTMMDEFDQIELWIKTSSGQEDSTLIRNFDSNCETCRIIQEIIRCMPKENICILNNTCLEQGSDHPNDQCLQCLEGQWHQKSDGFISLATSQLNKKFKVISGDIFEYNLPKIDNATEFELISGPYGAVVFPNGTLSWKAISNLIADSWSEFFIIKAKSICGEYTLIEVNVHVISCECTNDATCILIQDIPKCICKPGFKGDKCEIMDDPCMVPRCNYGQCIPNDGINFKCLCDPGYTGPLCNQPLKCNCYPGVECLDHDNCGSCPPKYIGDGFSCQKIRPCEEDPCHPGVECFAIGDDDYVCGTCPPEMTGNGKKCYESSDDFFAQLCDHDETNPCFDKSLCQVDKQGGVYCQSCPKGFKGDGITCYPVDMEKDPCLKDSTNPCYPGSHCSVVNGIVTCGPCPMNMTGDGKFCVTIDCDKAEDCAKNICPPGFQWQVDQCVHHNLGEQCHPNSCFPGVQCEIQDGQPICGACPFGYIGDGINCVREVPVDHCQSEPCFPGVECYNYADDFKCGKCPEGFTGNGNNCSPEFDPCDPNPCYFGVPCLTIWKGRQTSFECGLCPDGMIGDGLNCTITDPCVSSPCPLGTSCVKSVIMEGQYECKQTLESSISVPCPDQHHCYPGVECIMTNITLLVPYITCGNCPEGYSGDGIQCKPKCDNCNESSEVCMEPGICKSELKVYIQDFI